MASCPTSTRPLDDHIDDDLLRLIFVACHPVLTTEARVALTLRMLGGLTTDEIARAFLVPRVDDRAADRPGQEDPRRRRGPVRGAGGRPSASAGCRPCSRSST